MALAAQTSHKRMVFGGDCYNYGLLASGHLDLVVEAGLKLHDFAALVPIVEGAGGTMCDWNGEPLNADSAKENRSEEHTSELQSLMRISYAVFCLKKKRINSHYLKDEPQHLIIRVGNAEGHSNLP